MPRKGLCNAGLDDIGNHRHIDAGDHRLPRPIGHQLFAHDHLFAPLHGQAQAQTVDTVQGHGEFMTAVQREARYGRFVITVAACPSAQGLGQPAGIIGHERLGIAGGAALQLDRIGGVYKVSHKLFLHAWSGKRLKKAPERSG